MPKFTAKDRKTKRRYAVTWEKGFNNIVVSMDHNLLGRIDSKDSFVRGAQFDLPEHGSKITVRIDESYPMGDVHMKVDNRSLSASSRLRRFLEELWIFWP